jgi:23S rRNA (guanosine2251-2'-O)-methyltransferase
LKKPPKTHPNQILIYGIHPVLETIKAGRRQIRELIMARESLKDLPDIKNLSHTGIPVTFMKNNELSDLTLTQNHQGIAAKVGPFPYAEIESITSAPGPIMVLDEIQDTSNLGNIMRSTECLGGAGIVLSKDRAAPITAAVEKASAGASAYVKIARVTNLARTLESLQKTGYWIYAAESGSSTSLFDIEFQSKSAVVLGSEATGIRRLIREKCDFALSVPMIGKIESLNVAQTAAIILSEALRRSVKA